MRGRGFVLAGIVALSCGAASPARDTTTVATETTPGRASATETTPATPSPKTLWSPAPAPQYLCGQGVASGACAPEGISWVGIDSDGRSLITAVLRPAQTGAARVVIYLHSDEGLLPRDVDFAAALAKEGFLVLAPCWQRPLGRASPRNIGCAPGAPLRSSAIDVVKDINAIADAARTLPGAKSDRVVVVGHSGGGTAAVLAGSMGGHIDAVAALSAAYGTDAIKDRWGTSAPEQVDGLAVPLLIVHGTDDLQGPGSLIETVRAYEKAARDKGKNVDTLYLDGANHLFPFFQDQGWTDDVRGKVVAFLRG